MATTSDGETGPASGVTRTAAWAAAVRAHETQRKDALYRDPWAAALAGHEGEAWLAARTDAAVLPMVLRTRYFDDWLERAVADGIDQVVLLAAGLDTRAFRLDWPAGARCFEVDRAVVLDHKAAVLDAARATARCRRTVVAADLAGEWAEPLHSAGLDASRPSAWLAEGLLFYLPPAVIDRVLRAVGELAPPGSRLGFDIVNAAVLTSSWTKHWVEMQEAEGAPWLGTMEDPVGSLARLGWRASLTAAGRPDANHGRWAMPVLPLTAADLPHSWLVTAVRDG
ncbi:MAG TPA: SAM-dependent methyltransferase [Candidatus Limnocylindrales bacterium]|nr:SAM-dependent methyltransferase [Candidatus Limnocylindrales bacterium]